MCDGANWIGNEWIDSHDYVDSDAPSYVDSEGRRRIWQECRECGTAAVRNRLAETFQVVAADVFIAAFDAARAESGRIREATSEYVTDGENENVFHLLSPDGRTGYACRIKRGYIGMELTNVFSLVSGRGNDIVADAVTNGASYLDCFDGYLPTLYKRHGFVEYKREPNWTPGGPDVVFMIHP